MSYPPIPFEPELERHSSPNHTSAFAKGFAKSKERISSRRLSRNIKENGRSEGYPLIVHCHLCWDWVWQRPQQFISRLSKNHKTLFIETIGPDPELAVPVAKFR